MSIDQEELEAPAADDRFVTGDPDPSPQDEGLARQQAIKQIERRRHFRIGAVTSAIAMAVLVAIWALSEYHNAGGWPTQGFSQSSGIHDVWNYWIVYPVGAWILFLGARAWLVYGHKPISETEIEQEMERQTGAR